ncbi:SAM-dependent methyltransferase [Aliarcobacter trophiarum LMG 25534]|uniref:SAM-dependent methyltransferase n=1 Tax=Aliarcobacter trophiarum LMG 25534 TaxID=1032241 RepID=A0AAD0QJX1_9BACT|nr:class I SAM-dependent methyltransferase [Aliarcobacter trophiarum]AXK48786.1 SAM-dependent methyltransferase [Aliarcobacter trophiarum LMG 25534]RXJ92107.1 SAM-dependent methyltransferase [Aliarcobacter trophiarum LMG 25534]
MIIEDLKKIVVENLKNKSNEIKRVFHGRGNYYSNFSYLTVDSLNNILFATFFEKSLEEDEILESLKSIAKKFCFETFIIQRKYKERDFYEVIYGESTEDFFVVENGLKYKIDFKNRNIGLFFDMKRGREYIKSICKDKKVLNLFSYSCAFSVVCISGGALSVVNIDMSKASLSLGRINHHLNNLDTKSVKFLPYNILKSFGKIKKMSPYDIVIIDPPSFQKGSFVATDDYIKIIKKLDFILPVGGLVLACLNDPFLSSNFLIEIFKKEAQNFEFLRKLENIEEFVTNDEEKSLKNLLFLKKY